MTKTPKRPALTRQSLAKRLLRLARQMDMVGLEMVYYGGFSALGRHGHEMLGVAALAQGWAKEMVDGE